MNHQLRGLTYAGITAVCWGFLAIGLKVASNYASAVDIVWFRLSVAFFFFLGYLWWRDSSSLKILIRPPRKLVFAALLLGVNYIGFMKGVVFTDPNVSQVLIQIGPILLGAAGFMIFKEKINYKQGIGFLIAAVGLYLFYQENLKIFVAEKALFNQGVWWILAAGVAWTFYAIFQKQLLRTISAFEMNLVIFGLPMLISTPFVDFGSLITLNFWQWMLLIGLGLNTLIAYGTLALSLQYADANKVSVIITMNPIITVFLMALLAWMEVSWIKTSVLSWQALLAAALVIGGGTVAVLLRSSKKIR
jgi:drug/metabolite transporter (DMT)-like permease